MAVTMRFQDVFPAAAAIVALRHPAVSAAAFGAPSATNVAAARALWKRMTSSGRSNAYGKLWRATDA